MIKVLIPKMIKQKKGNIINMSSIVSSLRGLPNRFVYGSSKAAIVGLTKSIAADFTKDNIRCNAIAPGTVHTPSWEDRVKVSKDPIKAKKDFIARQPMGRIGTPEEIAVSIMAEVLMFRLGGTGLPMKLEDRRIEKIREMVQEPVIVSG